MSFYVWLIFPDNLKKWLQASTVTIVLPFLRQKSLQFLKCPLEAVSKSESMAVESNV